VKKRSIVAATTVVGLSLALAATPAYAADFSGDQIDFGSQYYFSDVLGGNGLKGAYPDDWQLGPDGNMFDEGMTVYGYTADGSAFDQVTCADPADLVTATDATGDQILTCDPYSVVTGDGTLDVVLEYRYYAAFSFVRLRAIITNSSGAPVNNALFDLYDDYYQDSETYLSFSNTAGLQTGSWPATTSTVLTDADLVYAFDDRTLSLDSPVVMTGRGLANSSVLPYLDPTFLDDEVAGNSEDDNNSYYRLPTLAPGQTVELALFHKAFTWGATGNLSEDDTLAAINAAWADKGIFDSFTGPLIAGIADPTIVLNWDGVPVVAEVPALAATGTGTETSALVLTTALLLLLGAALAAGSRLKFARRS
jgi:hypothetical protein